MIKQRPIITIYDYGDGSYALHVNLNKKDPNFYYNIYIDKGKDLKKLLKYINYFIDEPEFINNVIFLRNNLRLSDKKLMNMIALRKLES